jgi:hypothetical protein
MRKGKYCFDGDLFPCTRLWQSDSRYRKNHRMSMRENPESVRNLGIRKFIRTKKNSDGPAQNAVE